MATDRYNFQYTVLTILQKSYQYALAMMKYRAQKSRQDAEMKFYERIYGRAIKNPESVRIAYTQDDLTPQAFKELAAEHGIPLEIDPYGHNFVIYDARYEAQLIRIIAEAEQRDRRLFEENHFHETQYGYECYATGEYIPYVDPDTGSFLDKEGRLHRGENAGEMDDDELIDRLSAREFDPDAVWDRQPDGTLRDEFGYIYQPAAGVEKDNSVSRPARPETSHARTSGPVYTRCPGGYRAEDGSFIYNYNEYGDYYSPEDNKVHLNRDNHDNEEARIQRLYAQERDPVNTGYRYMRSEDGNLVNVESGISTPLRDEDGVRYGFYEEATEKELREDLGEERVDEKSGEEYEAPEPEQEEIPEGAKEGLDKESVPEEGEEKKGRKKSHKSHQEEKEYETTPSEGQEYEESPYEEHGSVEQSAEETSPQQEESVTETLEEQPQPSSSAPEVSYEEESYSHGAPQETYTEPAQPSYEENQPSQAETYTSAEQQTYTEPTTYQEVTYQEAPSPESTPVSESAPSQENPYVQESPAPQEGASQPSSTYEEPYSGSDISGSQAAGVESTSSSSVQDSYEKKHYMENAETAAKAEAAQRAEKYADIPPVAGTTPAAAAGAAYVASGAPGPEPFTGGHSSQTVDYSKYTEAISSAQYTEPAKTPETGYKGGSSQTYRSMPESKTGSEKEGSGTHYRPLESSSKFNYTGVHSELGSTAASKSGMEEQAADSRPSGSSGRGVEYTAKRDQEQRNVSGNIIRKNKEALHGYQRYGSGSDGGEKKDAGQEAYQRKAEKFGFENMTAKKKYGFQSMSPGARLQKPSADGLLGAIAGGYKQVVMGAEKENKVHVVRYYRNIGAVANVAGGAIIFKNAAKTAEEYFSTLRDSGKLVNLNKILTANGRKGISAIDSANIRSVNNSLTSLASKAGVVQRRGGMLFLNKIDKNALARMGAMTEADGAILKNALENAVSYKNGRAMMSRGGHVLYYSIRMAMMSSDDRTLGYVSQGMDTIRVFRQLGKSTKEAWDSRILNKPLKETAVQKAPTPRPASQHTRPNVKKGSFHFRKDATTPLRSRGVNVAEERMAKNAKAVKRYNELRNQQASAKYARLHKGLEARTRKLNMLKNARLQKIEKLRRAGNRLTDAAGRPFHNFRVKLGNTRIGRKLSIVRKSGVEKAAAKNAAKKVAARTAQKAAGKAIEGAAKALSSLMSKLLIVLGIYILACCAILLICTIALVPVLGQMSAETDDKSLVNGTDMEDVYDKSHTMTGIIYNELRYMELEWASQIRSYGTEENPVSLNALNFTEYNVSARQYVLSQTGADDLLGTWAYDSTKTSFTGKRYEGILGPEPFEGAALQDYKLLRDVDGGSTMELRGKPQEGYTSNAKQVTAMASVFYSQTVDTLMESSNSEKGLAGFLSTVKNLWKAAWTWVEENNVPILGEIGKMTGWSWTSVYRNYAYPLMQASHQENFFLSSYLYPTKYTYGSADARWDGAKGGNPDENGDQTVKIDQVTGQQAKNGRIGVTTEGGSGKVSSDFKVSDETYQGQGDSDWEAIEMCPDDTYNGYGCAMRKSFGYRYNGHFATDMDNNILHADELATLYYGSDPDEETEFGGASDVSADVSPWDTDSEAERGFSEDSCIVNILQLTNDASNCWVLDSRDSLDDYDFENETDLLNRTFKSSKMNDEYLNRGFLDMEQNLTIQKIEETEDGCDVYVSYPFEQEQVIDPIDGPLYDDYGNPIMRTDYTADGYILHFKHACQQDHAGYFCGGHLQLRTRGIVYGFSEDQSNEGKQLEDGAISAFAPKYLDPVNYKDPNYYEDAEDRLPNDSDATQAERDAYPDLHVWNVDEHSLQNGESTPKIEEDDLQTLYLAEDIFDIDNLIKRQRKNYPGYSGKTESSDSSGQTTAISKWTGWTLTNMSQAVSLTYTDWFETYALADTQTAVGAIYNNTAAGLNNMSDAVVQKIAELLAADLDLKADILDPEATNLDGDVLTDEERERIDRVRHVLYALSCVGEVSYSQSEHANMYGNLKGKATDCSGFVCNVWRDRIEAPYTVSGLYNSGIVTPKEYHGINTSGIEPGDIILVNPDQADGEAHALIYVGTFNTADLYGEGEGTGEERVFTVDCSSMVYNINDLASTEDTPVESMMQDGDGNQLSVSGLYESQEVEDTPKVRSGNVRFADRDYMNDDNSGNMYYIDMSEWPRIGQRQLIDDFSDLGDSGVTFWNSAAVITDLTQTRQELDIQFDVNESDTKDPVEDVEIPEDTRKEPVDEAGEPIVSGNSVVLQMNQYIQQGGQSYSSQKRGGIGSNSTIGSAGCTDCSYLMAASYYTGITFDVGDTLSNSRYYDGNAFAGPTFLSDYGLQQNRVSGYHPNAIRDAIDQGHPVIMQIKGYFSFHNTPNTHFIVIMGYDDNGFMIYDPNKPDLSYNVSGRSISYEAFTNGPGSILDYRIITQA